MDFILSLRSSSKLDTSAVSAHRALRGAPCARGGRLPECLRPRRSQTVVAGAGYQFSRFANNGDGSCVWKAPNSSLYHNCHLHSCGHDQHHHHHHTETSCCHSRPGLGFAATASGDTSDVDEHVCCESSFLHNCSGSPSVDWEKSNSHLSSTRGVVAGVGVPLSLRMLKRKQQCHGKTTLTSGLVEVGNSLVNAFCSMVFMMKELQSHCLHIQQQFCNREIEGLVNQVHRDMHASFLWLFQQVFSCTPELMVLLMVLLADFTAFSMVSSVPMGMTLPASMPSFATNVSSFVSHTSKSCKSIQASPGRSIISSPSLVDSAGQLADDNSWIGNGGRWNHKRYSAAGDGDGEFDTTLIFSSVNKGLYSVEDSLPSEMSSLAKAMQDGFDSEAELLSNQQILSDNEFSSMAAVLAFKELNTEKDALSGSSSSGLDQNSRSLGSSQSAGLSDFSPRDHPAIQSFVAPFTASVEDDSYTCYDRTDLAYQYAINSNATNSMLLANYAQFLFLVRKDNDRAEELFRRAVLCDPQDGDAISRFASFLWLARHNLTAAGKAYQAAVHADPCNSFHAADYAHFLWNSGQ